jgi:hypothetical protein
MSMQRELDALAEKGGTLLDDGDASAAEQQFERGYALSRQARNPQSMAWFLAHRGFARVKLQSWALAVADLTQSILLGQLGNPYVHLMRGIALYEQQQHAEAKSELFKAAALVGHDVFDQEHPKYWAFAIKGMRTPEACDDWMTWAGCDEGSAMHDALCDPTMYRVFTTPEN